MKFAEKYDKGKIPSFSAQIFFDYRLPILELYA
jgi:hypothetical protein